MTVRTDVVMGVDVGTTSAKVLVRGLDGGREVLVSERTPWTTAVGGGTETTPAALLDMALGLLTRAAREATARLGSVRVAGVGVAGLAESGVLLDSGGAPCAPVIAWFDRRGGQQVDAVDSRTTLLREQFARHTGLPWDCQPSIAKLLWLRDTGTDITSAHRWASVPEWIVHQLGADLVREPSLASRTGLVDQGTGEVWDEGLDALQLPGSLLPPPCLGGRSAGVLRHPGLPVALQGAALTVAGHDHAVAAVGVGAAGPDELFNSTGTADVLARSIPGVLDEDQRELLVAAGLSAGAHVLESTTLVLGGARGGLLLRRLLDALGAATPAQRNRLDRAALAVVDLPPGLEISGAGPTGDDVVLRLRDDASPAALWAAATRYAAAETGILLAAVDHIVGPHRRAVASGGWTRMASVRAAKSSVIDHLTFSPLPEPGVVGAALFAARAAGVTPVPVAPAPPMTPTSPTPPTQKETS